MRWVALVLLLTGHGASAQQAPEGDPALMAEGRYLATAADCAGCHGTSFAGGEAIASPMGDIYASNITPDATGIGGWTLAQFSDVLRRGKGPDGHIYPAMPYTSYTGLTDEQIAALYAYFMQGVTPVRNVPSETDLPFPFWRPAMIAWNALFLDEGHATGAVAVEGAQERRGRTLVESLGHCSACHSPRGVMMQQIGDQHLSGAMTGGWWAPNITPDETGTGGWSDERLARFLMTGHTDAAVAAGEMGTVVSRSLSRLPREDIDAIVAYLRAVPPRTSSEPGPMEEPAAPVSVPGTGRVALQVAALEPADDTGWRAMLGHDGTDGSRLYQSACATCHGIDGAGSADLAYPSLHRVDGAAAPHAATLVQVIAHGVDRRVGDAHALMPGFRADLDDDQIAAVANHVRAAFVGVPGTLDAAAVRTILSGEIGTPWLIENAHWLAVLGVVLAILALALLGWVVLRRFGRRRPLFPM